MLNFTVGPVMSCAEVLDVASKQTPYFRTMEFSRIMLENEHLILDFLNAPAGSHCVFLTASGTGGMESCVMNVLNKNDKAIVINGGTFGKRFADLCTLHSIETIEIDCKFGMPLQQKQLEAVDVSGCSALLVNMCETSSGILYDMEMISAFCKKHNLLLIVDAISSFIADFIDMKKWNAAAVIIGSQKALAVQPGVSAIVLAETAIKRIKQNEEKCMYLSLKEALLNMERGQTPFTPAVSTLMQMNTRLKQIANNGGIETEAALIASRARYFRDKITELDFEFIVPNEKSRAHAVTAIRTRQHNAEMIFNMLKDNYGIWICPNGGIYKQDVFRVGHIGELALTDYDLLIDALWQLKIK